MHNHMLLRISFPCLCGVSVTIIFFYAVIVVWPLDHVIKSVQIPTCSDNKIAWESGKNKFNKLKDKKAKRITPITKDPVIVWWTSDMPWMEIRMCPGGLKCQVYHSQFDIEEGAYLFYGQWINFSNLPLPRRSKNIIWGLKINESPRNVYLLAYDKVLKLFNFSSSYSRFSDVPFPLLHIGSLNRITSKKYFVETSIKNIHLRNLAPVVYIQNNCDTTTERDDYVRELMKYINIDSYGDCLNNKRFNNITMKDHFENLRFISKYKFSIAIENAVCNDYVSEKLWRPMRLGSVPIYFGSPTIRDWLPNNKSAILLEDYRTPKALSEHLKKLLADDKLYEECLEHKIKGLVTNQKLINELKLRPYQGNYNKASTINFECFICDKLHRRKTGSEVSVVNKSHFDCPEPVSALSQKVNPLNKWVRLGIYWNNRRADKIYDLVSSAK